MSMQNILHVPERGRGTGLLAEEVRQVGSLAKSREGLGSQWRSSMFRIGTAGLTCAAHKVAIEGGSQDREGTIRPVRDCSNPVAEVIEQTGLCADCAPIFRLAIKAGRVKVVERIEKS
jgi:hypothetical protein